MTSIDDVQLMLRASYKLLMFCTQEELRAEAELFELSRKGEKRRARSFFAWTETAGFQNVQVNETNSVVVFERQNVDNCKQQNPVACLQWIIDRVPAELNGNESPALYVMKDLHSFISPKCGETTVIRKLKDAVQALQPTRSSIIVLCPFADIPPELEKEAVVVDFELPAHDEILARLNKFVDFYKDEEKATINLDEHEKYRLAKAATGLTMSEADLAFQKALVEDSILDIKDIELIIDEKKQIIRKGGILTYEEPGDFEAVGGLDNLKKWLRKREHIFSENAREYGLPEPKGVMLTGIPGCGKSLCARAMSSLWQIPLLRLDMGAIFAGLVGSSEANMRRAISSAEAMSPCVLMIDEIEKGLAGSSGGGGDSGTSSRVFGTLLSWMNDKTKPVFVVATANNFNRIPPEMLRKGRFDEIFFVDCPNAEERKEIFSIHLRKRDRDPENYDLAKLVKAAKDFTGAEIEQAVITGMIEGFANGRDTRASDFTTDDILHAIKTTLPLTTTMGDELAKIRTRSKDCTVAASKNDDESKSKSKTSHITPAHGGAQLDL
jgi:SpoVK/Ycf46/Vps4 family AAA+-type ATPase